MALPVYTPPGTFPAFSGSPSDCAKQLEAYIHSTPYTGNYAANGGSSSSYYGWPTTEIMKLIPDPLKLPVIQEFMKRAMPGRSYTPPAPPSAPRPPQLETYSLPDMLAMRMRWTDGWRHAFLGVNIHATAGIVRVWIITKSNESVVLEDTEELYPSDALITKIRMLQ